MMTREYQFKLLERIGGCGKTTVLDVMRSNPEYLDCPGYEMSQTFLELTSDGYLARTEDEVKAYYEITPKGKDWLSVTRDSVHSDEYRKKVESLKQEARALCVTPSFPAAGFGVIMEVGCLSFIWLGYDLDMVALYIIGGLFMLCGIYCFKPNPSFNEIMVNRKKKKALLKEIKKLEKDLQDKIL